MSQQEFSYFDPEQETAYKPRNINEDPRESREYQEEQEQGFYYITPEQSMLRGEKLVPMHQPKSYTNWMLAAVFLLMILVGGLIWGTQVRPEYQGPTPYPGKHPPIYLDNGHPFDKRDVDHPMLPPPDRDGP